MLGRDVVHKGFRFLWCECRVRERSFGLKYTLDIANCEMERTPCRNVEWLYRKEVWPEIGMLPCARWPVERRSCSRGYLGHGGSRNDGSDLDGDGFGVRNGSRGRRFTAAAHQPRRLFRLFCKNPIGHLRDPSGRIVRAPSDRPLPQRTSRWREEERIAAAILGEKECEICHPHP